MGSASFFVGTLYVMGGGEAGGLGSGTSVSDGSDSGPSRKEEIFFSIASIHLLKSSLDSCRRCCLSALDIFASESCGGDKGVVFGISEILSNVCVSTFG